MFCISVTYTQCINYKRCVCVCLSVCVCVCAYKLYIHITCVPYVYIYIYTMGIVLQQEMIDLAVSSPIVDDSILEFPLDVLSNVLDEVRVLSRHIFFYQQQMR